MSDQLLGDGEEKKKRITLNIDTKMLKIGFIGGGKMAQALARGFIRSGIEISSRSFTRNNLLFLVVDDIEH